MGVVMFYHLTRSTVGETAANLLTRALGAGWRVMVRGTDRAALEQLDEALWLSSDESFLPHGLEGGPHDADQPVLLGTGAIANAASCLMLVDGADVAADEARPLERVWLLFDGNDTEATARARGHWKALTAEGLAAQYWSEESGRWEKKAESAAKPA
jgi:DNA polymerase-3 subunit chi